jgi:DNA-binding HxlR family transcriptional regulator
MVSDDVRDIVGRKHTIEILRLLITSGRLRYSKIENTVDTSSDMVTDSLQLLCEHGLVERIEKNQKNVEYKATETGREFVDAVQEIESLLRD